MSQPPVPDAEAQRRREAIEASGGNVSEAARQLGMPIPSLSGWWRNEQIKARHGQADGHFVSGVAPGYLMGKVTVQRGPGGDVERTWERQSPDDRRTEEAFRRLVEDLVEPLKGLAPFTPPPPICDADLLAVYPIGDHHHGMYSDASETGADYDCGIAENLLVGAVDHLCTGAPAAEEALLLNVGDFFHANDSTNETPGHGNRLDVDTRYGRVMESGAMSLIRCILRLLEKHRMVRVWNLRGNHDPDAAFALGMAIRFYFHDEPRVEVDLGSSLYKYLRFGKCLIGGHHGHGAKGADLPLIMAHDRKEDWGQTDHRVWHCGHIHHRTAKEHPGCDVETHRTLAAGDAWHAGKGYRSKRGMSVIVYHRELGEVQRNQFIPEMLRAAA